MFASLTRRWPLFVGVIGLLAMASPWLLTPVFADGKKDKREIRKIMSRWKNELGLKDCSYCHVKNGKKFDYEASTPKKTIAHYCEEEFVEKLKTADGKPVSCRTCHNRKTTFLPRNGEGEDDHDDEDEEQVEGR